MLIIEKNMRKTLFLTGLPRSGTTWSAEMLGLSPSVIHVTGEPFNPINSKTAFGFEWSWYYAISGTEGLKFENTLKNLFNQKWTLSDFIRRYHYLIVNKETRRHLYTRIIRLFNAYLLGTNKTTLLKCPIGFFSTEQIAKQLNAQIILLTRHPAAFINSMQRVGWEVDVEHLFKQPHLRSLLEPFWDKITYYSNNKNAIESIDKNILAWNIYHYLIKKWQQKYPDWIVVSHEQLSLNPTEEFKDMYQKLHLVYNLDVEREIIEHTQASNKIDAGDQIHLLKRDSKANMDVWKKHLSKEVIDKIYKETKELSDYFYPQASW